MAHHHHHLVDVRTELRSSLRSKGLRATGARLAVMLLLHEQQAPMSHEQLMTGLGKGAFDPASIWRLLSDLTDAGVLRRMDLGDRIYRFELFDDCRDVAHDHGHFLCEDCGDVSCLPEMQLTNAQGQLPAALVGAQFRVRVTGRCGKCITD